MLASSNVAAECSFRQGKVEDAQKMLIDTLRWRHTFRASETITETFPEDVFGKLCHNFGKDKGGRPITYAVIRYPVACIC